MMRIVLLARMRQAPTAGSAVYPWDDVAAFCLEAAITKTESQFPLCRLSTGIAITISPLGIFRQG